MEPRRLHGLAIGDEREVVDALVGSVAIAALQMLHVDRLFLGVHGLDLGAGLTTPNLVEAETNRALLADAIGEVVIADVPGLAPVAEKS